MTPAEYLAALRAAALAGDRKAAAFLEIYAGGLVALPELPADPRALKADTLVHNPWVETRRATA